MNWLHWIGQQCYTMNSFIKEAQEYGVSRDISPWQLRLMHWQDAVYCAMLDSEEVGVIFGYFKVEQINGIASETSAKIREDQLSMLVNPGGGIARGCYGKYAVGPTYGITACIKTIATAVREIETNKGRSELSISGRFEVVDPVRIPGIPFCTLQINKRQNSEVYRAKICNVLCMSYYQAIDIVRLMRDAGMKAYNPGMLHTGSYKGGVKMTQHFFVRIYDELMKKLEKRAERGLRQLDGFRQLDSKEFE